MNAKSTHRLATVPLLIVCFALTVLPGLADNYTWTGTNGNWSDSSNWIGPVGTTPDDITDTATISSGIVTVNIDTTVGTLNFEGGEITGTNKLTIGNGLTISNVMNWTSGTMSGAGTTVISSNATLNLNNSAPVDLSQRRLENAGLVVWTGTGDFQCQNGPVLTNVPGGIWEVRNNQSFVNTYGTSPRFDNAGIFRKITGTGTTTFNTFYAAFPFPFNNYGMVDFQTGTLEFKGQFNHSGGPITIPSGSVLRLSGGGTATGVFANQSGAEVDFVSTYSLNAGAQVLGPGNYTNRATLILNTNVEIQNFGLAGAIDGTGKLTIGNVMNWTSGAMNGVGTTVILPGATLNLNNSAAVDLSQRRLENAGLVVWTGTGDFQCQNGPVLTNVPGGIWEVRNNQSFVNTYGTSPRFDNAGIFRKTTGTGTTTFTTFIGGFGFPFNNWGTNHVQSGTLQLNDAYTQYGGLTSLCDGNINNAYALEILGGVLRGSHPSSPAISGGVNNVGGVLRHGCSPGKLVIGGNYSQSDNATLELEIGGIVPGTSHDQLAVTGTANLAGQLVAKIVDGYYPSPNAVFAGLTASSRTGAFASFSYPSNEVGMALNYSGTNATLVVVNVRPTLPEIQNQTNAELALFSLPVNATNSDTPVQILTYALTNSPTGATIDSSGLIQWTPTEAQGPMTTNITVCVTDNGTPNLSATRTFQITVNEVNATPQLGSLSNYTVNAGQTVSFTATATDADWPSNSWTFSLVNPPAGAAIDANSGSFNWRVPVVLAGSTTPISVRVEDDGVPSLNAEVTFNVTVQPLTPLILSPLEPAPGQFGFSVMGPVGPDYILQRSSDLSIWTSFLTNTPASVPFTVTDTNVAALSNQFYRARLEP